MKNNYIIKNPKKQEGMVLIVALIMLLMITVLGVAAVNRSNVGTQVAGNSMSSMLVYQGAETGVAKTFTGGKEQNIDLATLTFPAKHKVPDAELPEDKVAKGVTMKSRATVESVSDINCAIISGLASSSKYRCRAFEADVSTNLLATSATARHLEGRTKIIPK